MYVRMYMCFIRTSFMHIHTWLHAYVYLNCCIYRYMLKSLQKCHYDVKRISNCFVRVWEDDAGLKIYSDYCSLYPT